jgi:signal transduction histidine kinase/DNA-binding NarL/FixJ family response regulator
MRQILNADVKTAEREQEQLQAKASCIGHTTFMWGMTLLFVAFFLNIGNSYRRARTVKKLERESEKNMHLYKSRREMMYMVTHELRTPLSPVIGYSSLMKQTANLDRTNKKYLDKIYESAEKMKTLINSLLEYFAIESDKTDIAKKPFNMKNMAEMMTATYALEARQKGLEFIANDCENLALMGDESKLIQIGSNLLANAVKFTETGSVSLNVTYEDDALKIEVSDTGIGIAEEEQQKIFEPFKQLGKAKAMATDGIGLGLSIVSQLVKLMDGNIELQSHVGEGSRFTVTIPVERMTEENYAVAEKKPTEDDGIRRVLAIDDTESFLDMMRDILRENGVECDTCTKAKELVEHMREKDYDLLVIDLKMPDINGIELAQTLRESEVGNSKSVKMVVSTAWSDDHDAHELLDKGFDGILSKPFNTQDLMDMVNRFIPKGRKREVPDLSNASLNILPKLIKEVEDGVTALKDGLERNDMDQIGEWCHRLAGSWGMIHADEPLDELHELLKSRETMDEKALQTVIGKVEVMGNTIVKKAKERIGELENE